MNTNKNQKRDRFEDNTKKFEPKLVGTDNYGKHSPAVIYDTRDIADKKISKMNLKTSRPHYSFTTARRSGVPAG